MLRGEEAAARKEEGKLLIWQFSFSSKAVARVDMGEPYARRAIMGLLDETDVDDFMTVKPILRPTRRPQPTWSTAIAKPSAALASMSAELWELTF